ncbi:MAG: MGT family glycosyltransferase [Acidobacteriaceae bacterium]|nr:MGT family glycosyltransferase [Acidobacteriaceae bacterium]
MHFGIISPPVLGHIHPFGALGRELIARGHRVSLLHMQDVAEHALAEGLEFIPIGHQDHPPGSLARSLAQLGRLDGLSALRFTIHAICRTTEMMLRDAPGAILQHGIGALLVDQTEPAGGTMAEHLGIPFVTICNALALNWEPDVPPPFTGWHYRCSRWARARNRLGYAISDRIMRPVTRIVDDHRRKWNLASHRAPDNSFSNLAQISQQPPAFDFPRFHLPTQFHYVGPLRNSAREVAAFPWERLDGRPLIYASLGTLQSGKEQIFRYFAEACLGLNVQLVITHGGALGADLASSFPGNPLVVSYAPQLQVLASAKLTLSHAGLNTVLDSLSCGVPLVTVPITYEQPAIASRVRWSGAGEVLPLSKIGVQRLRTLLERVLGDSRYYHNAQVIKESIERAGGTKRATEIITTVI